MAHGERAERQHKEWWSKRPGARWHSVSYRPGENKWWKRLTHRIERRFGKEEIKQRIEEE